MVPGIIVGIALLTAIAVLVRKGKFLPAIIGMFVFIIAVMVTAPALFLPSIIAMVVLAIILVVRVPAFRRGPAGLTMGGFFLGSVGGGIVLGVIGYSQADPNWRDIQTVVSAAMGVVGGGGVGALLGWLLGRYLIPKPPPD